MQLASWWIYPARSSIDYRQRVAEAAGSPGWLGWVIAGGESGRGARPMHPNWARQLRDDCAGAGVPFFFKQWGEWAACQSNDGTWTTDAPGFCRLTTDGRRAESGWPMQRVGKPYAGHLLDGVEHHAFPRGPDVGAGDPSGRGLATPDPAPISERRSAGA
jgi:hypothetical protein